MRRMIATLATRINQTPATVRELPIKDFFDMVNSLNEQGSK